MAINLLSELNPTSRDWAVQVYVSRLWQHRGATDDGPIKHTDIVFQDTQGNHIYGEISTSCVEQFIDRVREGRVYELRRFLVTHQKTCYRPVEGQFIIRFGKYTLVREITDHVMDYPLCTYALTPIDELPLPVNMPETFTDVVGIITGVSPTTQYHSASRATPSTKRIIYLSDLNGYEISLILWGERAEAFDAESVLRTALTKPVVAIFVGTLVKPFERRRGLSGSAPCRWYINEDLPEINEEINELHVRLRDRIPVVKNIEIPGQSAAEISAQVDLGNKTVRELVDMDNLWENAKTRFYCTVTLTRLVAGERWWFSSCPTCNKGIAPYGTGYKCPDKDCGGVGVMPRYKLCYFGTDGTDEVELIFFEKAGRELIGKTTLNLICTKIPHSIPIEEAIQLARTDQSTPRELASMVTRKFRLVVSVTNKSFEPEADKPSYQVHRFEALHGKQPRVSAADRSPGLAFASSSKSASSALNSLGYQLAEDAILTQPGSSDKGVAVSDASGSADFDASTIVSGTVLPKTPPSVAKPLAASAERSDVTSSVKKALFEEDAESAEMDESQEVGLGLLDGSAAPPVQSVLPVAEKTPSRRMALPKAQADVQAKKKKT